MTVEQFRERYAGIKPYYEFWFGEAVQKNGATWLHGLLQPILANFFTQAGYKSGLELELRIDPDWQPIPDVAAASVVEQPYPTKPIEVVAEVLSPEDLMTKVLQKCLNYARIGISNIYVFDPESRDAWQWSRETNNLERTMTLILPNGVSIDVATVWAELDGQV
jgi:Uma2 family endonuclease